MKERDFQLLRDSLFVIQTPISQPHLILELIPMRISRRSSSAASAHSNGKVARATQLREVLQGDVSNFGVVHPWSSDPFIMGDIL